MSLYPVICLISSFIFLSPLPSRKDLVLVAQYSLYSDEQGSFITWSTKLNKNYYDNDCEALFDLYQYRHEICSPQEMIEVEKKVRGFLTDTTNYNRL